MKIIQECLDISYSLLPSTIKSREKNMVFHFAFVFRKSKLLSIGQNNPEKTHPMAQIMSDRFKSGLEYPYLHAETDAISKIWNKYKIGGDMRLVVLRLNRLGVLRNSKPCRPCSKIIDCLDFGEVYWSMDRKFVSNKGNEYEIPRGHF